MPIQLLSYFYPMKFRGMGWLIALALLGGLFLLNRSDVELTAQDSLAIVPIGSTGMELKSTLKLNNPNLLSATIKTIEEKFYINGVQVSILSMQPDQGIPGRKETALPVSVRFSRNDVQQFLPDSSVGTKRALVTITGTIDFTTMFGKGTIQVNQTDSLDLAL